MTLPTSLRHAFLIVLACLAATTAVTSANPSYFMKVDGVEGQSRDANHEKWIDLEGIDFSQNVPFDPTSSEAARRRGSAIPPEISALLAIDKSVPKLWEKLITRAVIPKIEIEVTTDIGGTNATFLRYELKNVLIIAFNQSGSAGDQPFHQILLDADEVKMTFTEYDAAGKKVGNIESNWIREEPEA